jgi:glutathione S-transferase
MFLRARFTYGALASRHCFPHSPDLALSSASTQAAVRERARARQVMAWLRSDLMPIREQRSAECVFYPRETLAPFAPLSAAAQRAVAKLVAAAEELVPDDGGPMFGAWCIADTDLAMMLQRLAKTGFELPGFIRAYADAQWQRSAVREFCTHPRPRFQAALS